MACFLVPGGEAIVASIVKKAVSSKEETSGSAQTKEAAGALTWKKKLSWLTNMLWGGAILLALEHIWHGEVVFYPPFLTAMSDPADTVAMIHEMSTVGVGMAVMVTVCWVVMVLIADHAPAIKRVLLGQEA
jgi:hypothetical protein